MEWVPKNKHALANGIAIGGSAIGAVVAPPLSVYLLGIVGWRGVFLVTGGFGFLWLLSWLFFTRKKRQVAMQTSEKTLENSDNQKEKIKLTTLLKNKEVRVFVVIRFVLDPIFYFYMFWIPKYLNEVHSLSLEAIGQILWIPFLALGLANILGGWISDLVFIKTSSVNLSRKIIMGIAAALTIPIVSVGFLHSYVLILALMALAFFAHGLWITNYITSIGDVFGKQVTSTVVGLSGSAGAVSSLVLNPIIGFVITRFSYSPLWWYAGLMYPLAFLFLLKFIPRIETLKSELA
jgi:ACS family hexuronate transporter-like MFS transporter